MEDLHLEVNHRMMGVMGEEEASRSVYMYRALTFGPVQVLEVEFEAG